MEALRDGGAGRPYAARREVLPGASPARAPAVPSSTAPPCWRQRRTEFRPATTTPSPAYSGSVSPKTRSQSVNVRVKRAGTVYGMSWFPGTARKGSPRPRSRSAAVSISASRPRCARSPVATSSVGCRSAISSPSAAERLPGLSVAHVQIGEVENACGHRRRRLYAGPCARTDLKAPASRRRLITSSR